MNLSRAYEARPIRFLELWQVDGWRLKVYGIACGRPQPVRELIDAGKSIARAALPAVASTHGVGFMGIHQARNANFVFVDWWANEYEIFHRLFRGQSFSDLAPVGVGGPTACTWDLGVVDFERRSWLQHVLKNGEGPDLEGYLAARWNEDV